MLLRVLTAALTLPTSPLLAELMSGASGRGEGVVGEGLVTGPATGPALCWCGGAEVVLVGPELELRMTRPPLPWSWDSESTRLAWPGPRGLGPPVWWSDIPVVLETWE